jgi:hypothetical protein
VRQPEVVNSHERARGVPSPRSAEATIVPHHGRGRLMPPIGSPERPYNPLPAGRPRTLKEVRQLCRKESLDAAHALISTYKTPEGLIDRTADPKVVVVAVQTLLKWAFGEPPPYDPHSEKPPMTVDLSGMSLDERRDMLRLMQRLSNARPDDTSQDNGPDFDPSRFAPLPPKIEAYSSDSEGPKAPQPVQSPTRGAPVRRKKRKKAKAAKVAAARKSGPTPEVLVDQPVKRGRGRPKGSKNKPKPKINPESQ